MKNMVKKRFGLKEFKQLAGALKEDGFRVNQLKPFLFLRKETPEVDIEVSFVPWGEF